MRSMASWAAMMVAAAMAVNGSAQAGREDEAAKNAAPAAGGTASEGADTAAVQPMQRALLEAQQKLADQSEAMRQLREQMERQGREIDELRQRLPREDAVATAAVTAARLEGAAAALRTHPASPEGGAAAAEGARIAARVPMEGPATLYFRIGNATFTPSGWVDFTTYYRSTDVGSGLGTTFQAIPYSNTVQGGQSETRFTAQSSRIGLKVDETVQAVKAYGYLEADFNGYLPGNAYVSTNSNTLRMRVYYLNLAHGKWEVLGGQAWSLLTPTRKALCPFLDQLFNTFHLDTSYQAGLVYARQPQLRVVYHPSESAAMGLSVEDPEQYSGSAVTFPTLFSTTQTDINSSTGSGGATATPNVHPDVVAKVTWDPTVAGLRWHVGAAGLLTSVRVVTPATVTKGAAASDEREGGGGIGNLYLQLFRGFHLIALGYWSDGGGRYIGGIAPGFVVLQPGAATAPFRAALLHSGSGIGGFEWMVPGNTTISAYYSGVYAERRYGLDPAVKTATEVGYGFPGSANTNNRSIEEASFASTTTLWKNSAYGALQLITQSSWVLREPWFLAPQTPKDAHLFMEFANVRFVLP